MLGIYVDPRVAADDPQETNKPGLSERVFSGTPVSVILYDVSPSRVSMLWIQLACNTAISIYTEHRALLGELRRQGSGFIIDGRW